MTGVRSSTAAAYAGLLNAAADAVRPRVRLARLLGRPRAARPRRARAHGRGRGPRRVGRRASHAGDALRAAGLEPVRLAEKEGLALINGTDGMLGMLVLAVHDASELLRIADVTASVSIQALRGTDRVFAEDLISAPPAPRSAPAARRTCARLLAGSPIVADHLDDESQVQDAYSLRCSAPGARRGARHDRPRPRRSPSVELDRRDRQPRRAARTAGCRRTATSTARRSATSSTSVRSRSPTSPRWPSGGPTGCSTQRAATGCRRSSRTARASTRGS